MTYNFDEVIDRSGTSAVKIEGMMRDWGRMDMIPLWVADMDFATPPFIREAISKRLEHPILGYTMKPAGYYQAIINWVKRRYGMDITKENLNYVPGIVPGLGIGIHCFTQPGEKVMIMQPVYHPFAWLVTRNGRTLVNCPLKLVDGHYHIDLELMRREIEGVKILMLCNPHNPGGVVWTREELQAVADLCAEHHVLVFSDEIHADLTLPPHKHIPFAMVSDKARNNSITFMAPSKTFNMPGMTASHTIIFDEEIRRKFHAYLDATELNEGHVLAFPAVEAAYNEGDEWLKQCLSYIQGNIDYVDQFLRTHAPRIRVMRPMASFLVWLDCRELNLDHKALNDFFVSDAHLALNDGEMFGKGGEGFMRLNVASPRSVMEQAMQQLAEAYRRRSF